MTSDPDMPNKASVRGDCLQAAFGGPEALYGANDFRDNICIDNIDEFDLYASDALGCWAMKIVDHAGLFTAPRQTPSPRRVMT